MILGLYHMDIELHVAFKHFWISYISTRLYTYLFWTMIMHASHIFYEYVQDIVGVLCVLIQSLPPLQATDQTFLNKAWPRGHWGGHV